MRLLLMGDFSADSSRSRTTLASRPTHRIDLDNAGDLMRRLAPRVRLREGEVPINDIDDFHPDRLYANLEVFRALREQRSQPPPQGEDFARLLGQRVDPDARGKAPALGRLDAMIHEIIAPHIVKDTAAQDRMFVEAVDAATASEMRAVLHAPSFQSLEAAWRGVYWLLSSLELDEDLQLHLFDVTRGEVLADIAAAGGKIASTGLYQALVDRWRHVPGGEGWTAIATLFEFDQTDNDIGLLAALGLLAAQAGAPLLGGAAPMIGPGGVKSEGAWHALRRSEAAQWIGLGAPRVLLRLPYGARTEPIGAFGFEEVAGEPASDELLWGNASLALTLLLGRAFMVRGADMEPGDERELEDLPAYTFSKDGESQLQPCAERYLSESQMQQLLDAGLIPLVSRRDRPAVVAIRFQSIADPPAPLAW